VIEAQAVARNPDGSVTIRTAQGDIRADLARAQVAELLRTGTRVTVELRNPTAQPPQLVLTVRGGATAGAGASTPTAQQSAVTTGASGPSPTVPLTVGRILQAVAVPGPAAAPAGTTTGGAAGTGPSGPAQVAGGQVATGQAAATPAGQAAQPSALPSAPAAAQTRGAAPAALPTAPGAAAPASGLPQGPAPSALAAQSAYRSALSLTGRAPAQPAPAAAQVPSPATPTGAQAQMTAGGGLAAATATAGGDPTAGPRLPTGAIVTVRVLATGDDAARFVGARTDAAPARQQTSGAPTVLGGSVAGVTQSGRPVIATSFGHLALNATSDLRIGDRVALDVLASRVGEVPTAERAAPLSVLSREWPALDGAMRVLQEALGPQAAAQITQAMVRPSPQMTAAMLFFMTALKGGDMRVWFGNDASRALEQAGRGGLLSALAEDFQTLQRASEPMDSGWRAFLIPVVGDERRPIRLLTRGRRKGGKDKRDDGQPDGTAFLVDLELSQLGPFRLDGLVRPDMVDLWIRTTQALPALMRHDIKALFDDTLDRTGIQGRLSFKATPVLPPLPIPELETGAAGDTESLFA
jgi:hypothetical protein